MSEASFSKRRHLSSPSARRHDGLMARDILDSFANASVPILPRAASTKNIKLNIGAPQQCSPLNITWDASKGTAPWTVTVAPVSHVPTTVQLGRYYLPSTTDYDWAWSYNVPSYNKATQLIVAVSDSTGKYSASSEFVSIGNAPGGNSCAKAVESLDFVWYTTPTGSPNACDDWRITWQEDKSNTGLVPPVSIVIIPENQAPEAYTIRGSSTKKFDWTVDLKAGTKFTMALYDSGKSGTGGVGGVYTVGSSKSTSCLTKTQNGQLTTLPGSSTLIAAASSTPKAGTHATGSSSAGKTDVPQSDADDSSSHSSSGAIIGGVVAAIAVIAILAVAWWLWRRNRRMKEDDGAYGVSATNVAPWRFRPASALGGKRGSRGLGSGKGTFTGPTGLGNSMSMGPTGRSMEDPRMHIMSERAGMSTTSLIRPSEQIDRPSFSSQRGAGQNNGTNPFGTGGSQLSVNTPGRKSMSGHSVYSTVPDDALFPPPPPAAHHVIASGSGSRSIGHSSATSDPFRGSGSESSPRVNATTMAPNAAAVAAATIAAASNHGHGQHESVDQESFSPDSYRSSLPRDSQITADDDQYRDGETGNYGDEGRHRQYSSNVSSSAPVLPEHTPLSPPRLDTDLPNGRFSPLPFMPSSNDAGRYTDGRSTAASTTRSKTPQEALGVHYIPPPLPVTTSIHDPYSHMSTLYSAGIGDQLWDDDTGSFRDPNQHRNPMPAMPSQYQQATTTSSRAPSAFASAVDPYARARHVSSSSISGGAGVGTAGAGGSQLLRNLQVELDSQRNRPISTTSTTWDEDEGALPYMR